MQDKKATSGPWITQELGQVRSGYPDWKAYAIRDAKTNVHIATVGNVDRYYEGAEKDHAALIAAAPALRDALARLEFAARARDNVMGDPCGLLSAKAELVTAADNARTALALCCAS